MRMPAELPLTSPNLDRWGEVNVTLTPLQRMIQEILDPLALHKRPVKEWRSLYKSWFAFFAPQWRRGRDGKEGLGDCDRCVQHQPGCRLQPDDPSRPHDVPGLC